MVDVEADGEKLEPDDHLDESCADESLADESFADESFADESFAKESWTGGSCMDESLEGHVKDESYG